MTRRNWPRSPWAMQPVSRSLVLVLVVVLALLVGACAPAGTKFPERPISLIVPNPPGGTTDLICRALSEAAKPYLPQPLTVVNRPGGAGTVGITEAIQAKPDGYTLAIGGVSTTMLQPHLSKLAYNGPEDYAPVIKLVSSPLVLAVRAEESWGSLKEMLDAAKANPGKLRVGTAGVGSLHHMHLEALKEKAGVNMSHVPFAGGAESSAALLGGHIEGVIIPFSVIAGHVKAGKLKLLVAFEEKRNPLYSDIPTAREAGFDITQGLYHYILTAKGTPDQVVQILHDGMKKAIETESFKKFAHDNGYVMDYKGPADLKRELEHDFTLFGDMVKKLNIKGA